MQIFAHYCVRESRKQCAFLEIFFQAAGDDFCLGLKMFFFLSFFPERGEEQNKGNSQLGFCPWDSIS